MVHISAEQVRARTRTSKRPIRPVAASSFRDAASYGRRLGVLKGEPMKKTPLAIATALVAALSLTCGAQADNNFSTRLANVPNAPVAIQSCQFDDGENLAVAVVNRTTYDLEAFRVGIRYHSSSGKIIGQAEHAWKLSSDPVVSGDQSAQKSWVLDALMNVDRGQIAYVECRVQSAVFSGHRMWRYGHPWKGKLLPMQTSMLPSLQDNKQVALR